MAKFNVDVNVVINEIYCVEANSIEEAVELVKNGEGEFVTTGDMRYMDWDEDVYVTDIDENGNDGRAYNVYNGKVFK